VETTIKTAKEKSVPDPPVTVNRYSPENLADAHVALVLIVAAVAKLVRERTYLNIGLLLSLMA
jgi:hypothetical protein